MIVETDYYRKRHETFVKGSVHRSHSKKISICDVTSSMYIFFENHIPNKAKHGSVGRLPVIQGATVPSAMKKFAIFHFNESNWKLFRRLDTIKTLLFMSQKFFFVYTCNLTMSKWVIPLNS